MVKKYLGDTIDIHCGGKDLEFPHHENEIAQSECATGRPFARYWLHNGFINIEVKNIKLLKTEETEEIKEIEEIEEIEESGKNFKKMSKSTGNFFTTRNIAENYGYMPLRFFILSSNYRMPLNYSKEVIQAAKNSLDRIFTFGENIEFLVKTPTAAAAPSLQKRVGDVSEISRYREKFQDALYNDFNTAEAISVLFELIKEVNIKISENTADKKYLEAAKELYDEFCGLFGFVKEQKESKESDIPEDYINEQIEKRTAAKKSKDFKAADEIRVLLKSQGIILEDTPTGIKWKRV